MDPALVTMVRLEFCAAALWIHHYQNWDMAFVISREVTEAERPA